MLHAFIMIGLYNSNQMSSKRTKIDYDQLIAKIRQDLIEDAQQMVKAKDDRIKAEKQQTEAEKKRLIEIYQKMEAMRNETNAYTRLGVSNLIGHQILGSMYRDRDDWELNIYFYHTYHAHQVFPLSCCGAAPGILIMIDDTLDCEDKEFVLTSYVYQSSRSAVTSIPRSPDFIRDCIKGGLEQDLVQHIQEWDDDVYRWIEELLKNTPYIVKRLWKPVDHRMCEKQCSSKPRVGRYTPTIEDWRRIEPMSLYITKIPVEEPIV